MRVKYPEECAKHDVKVKRKQEQQVTELVHTKPVWIRILKRDDGVSPKAADFEQTLEKVLKGELGADLQRTMVEGIEEMMLPAPWVAQMRTVRANKACEAAEKASTPAA